MTSITNTYTVVKQPRARDLLDSPYTSGWLKSAVEVSLKRDPLKALREIEILHALMKRENESAKALIATVTGG